MKYQTGIEHTCRKRKLIAGRICKTERIPERFERKCRETEATRGTGAYDCTGKAMNRLWEAIVENSGAYLAALEVF